MAACSDDWIDAAVAAQRPGWSLDQAFYTDPAIFRRDVERVLGGQWLLAGHAAQIPRRGDWFLFEVAGESLVLVRGAEGRIHAHYNVCRHRGSRVLLEETGNAAALTCRYHGWSYAHDGSLRSATRMPDDFERACHGLHPCPVTEVEGLIFVCLAAGEAPDFSPVAEGLAPFLRLQGTARAQVARRTRFPVHADWKLLVENYLECYHCKPAHREYCQVEIKAEKIGDGSPAALAAYAEREAEWRPRAEALGTLLPDFSRGLPDDDSLPRHQFGAAYRAPLRGSHQTGSEDGQPVAPLMGGFPDFDGGETALGAGPFTYMLAYCDYAALFQFVPRAPERSDMIVTWLVDAAAEPGRDYDPERVAWLWTVTSEQDKQIIENNAAGIRSARYGPGPASLLEGDVDGFRQWYLALVGPPGRPRRPAPGARYFGG